MTKHTTYPTQKLTRNQIRRSINHPVWFAQNILNTKPWQKQREILNAINQHDRVAVRSCNGSGKTYAAAIATLWWLSVHQEAVVITTAASERQVRQLLWREIRALYHRNQNRIPGKISHTKLDIEPRRFALGFTAKSAIHFQGFHSPNLLIIVDEASAVRETIFDAIFSCLTSYNSKLLIIGNPTKRKGTFYDAFHQKQHLWHNIHISAFETPAFQQQATKHDQPFLNNAAWNPLRTPHEEPHGIATPQWAQHIADIHGENSHNYKTRVLGQFPQKSRHTRSNHPSSLQPPPVIPAQAGIQPRRPSQSPFASA